MKKQAFKPDNLYTNIKEIVEVLEDLESVEEKNPEIRLTKLRQLVLGFLAGTVHILLF